MLLGKKIRLNRLLSDPSGKYLGITVDHAMARGVFSGLEDIRPLVGKIVAGKPDALTMHKGIATTCFEEYAGKVPLVLKVTTFAPVHPYQDIQVTSPQEAVTYGADAISIGAILLGEHQQHQIEQLGRISDEAHRLGIPVLAHIYPRGLQSKEDWLKPENLIYAVRLGAELGVDIVKTMYSGDPDSFAKVVAAAPIKVAVAGGDSHTIEETFKTAHDVIVAGGVGITFGRSVIQAESPTAFVQALGKIVHEGFEVKEAVEFYQEQLRINRQ